MDAHAKLMLPIFCIKTWTVCKAPIIITPHWVNINIKIAPQLSILAHLIIFVSGSAKEDVIIDLMEQMFDEVGGYMYVQYCTRSLNVSPVHTGQQEN